MAKRPENTPLPSTPGTYVLLLYLRQSTQLKVGRLGVIPFKRGWYAYVGSAFGPGGLAARLGRHLRQEKRCRWHIDYLRAISEPKEIWYSTQPEPLEHHWAVHLLNGPCTPINGFGCTDCHCVSHLIHFSRRPEKNCLGQIILKIELFAHPYTHS